MKPVALYASMSWPRRVLFTLGCVGIATWLGATVWLLIDLSGTRCFNFDALDCGNYRRGVFMVSAAAGVAFAFPGACLVIPPILSFRHQRHSRPRPTP